MPWMASTLWVRRAALRRTCSAPGALARRLIHSGSNRPPSSRKPRLLKANSGLCSAMNTVSRVTPMTATMIGRAMRR